MTTQTGEAARRADVIIVGAGSGGCVLARRLLDKGARVLLLEAGGPDTQPGTGLLIRAPAAFPKLFKTGVDWAFTTVEQPHAGGRRFYWPRGKVLGGSSAINATIYIRGSKADFDGWGEGWRWDDVLPAFRGIEKFTPALNNLEKAAGEFRGDAGELAVGHRAASHSLSHAFVQAASSVLGVPAVSSFNHGTLEGAGILESNHHRGERQSAFRAFLRPVLNHPNLTVLTGARVLELLWDGRRAVGVRMRWRGRTLDAPAGGVVLAAGAVQTPQLLMLSGVGPKGELTRHGIRVRVNLPGVGAGLQDHLAVPVIFRSNVPSLDGGSEAAAFAQWLLNRTGPLASNIAEASAFVRSGQDLEHADLQYHFGPAYFRDHGFQREGGWHFTVGPVLVEPYSSGRIGLGSADPLAAPRIDPQYLSDERDVRALVSGVRQAREIAAAAGLGQMNAGEVLPGEPLNSEAGLAEFVRQECATLYHPVGTAALGDGDDAVVDRQLAVRGTRGLWVADASVMPRIIHANTNATSMMIGARAAEFVGQTL